MIGVKRLVVVEEASKEREAKARRIGVKVEVEGRCQ